MLIKKTKYHKLVKLLILVILVTGCSFASLVITDAEDLSASVDQYRLFTRSIRVSGFIRSFSCSTLSRGDGSWKHVPEVFPQEGDLIKFEGYPVENDGIGLKDYGFDQDLSSLIICPYSKELEIETFAHHFLYNEARHLACLVKLNGEDYAASIFDSDSVEYFASKFPTLTCLRYSGELSDSEMGKIARKFSNLRYFSCKGVYNGEEGGIGKTSLRCVDTDQMFLVLGDSEIAKINKRFCGLQYIYSSDYQDTDELLKDITASEARSLQLELVLDKDSIIRSIKAVPNTVTELGITVLNSWECRADIFNALCSKNVCCLSVAFFALSFQETEPLLLSTKNLPPTLSSLSLSFVGGVQSFNPEARMESSVFSGACYFAQTEVVFDLPDSYAKLRSLSIYGGTLNSRNSLKTDSMELFKTRISEKQNAESLDVSNLFVSKIRKEQAGSLCRALKPNLNMLCDDDGTVFPVLAKKGISINYLSLRRQPSDYPVELFLKHIEKISVIQIDSGSFEDSYLDEFCRAEKSDNCIITVIFSSEQSNRHKPLSARGYTPVFFRTFFCGSNPWWVFRF